MNAQKIQATARILGIGCMALVVVTQLFKNQTFIAQNLVPYLIILSLVLLITSLFLKAKAGGFSQYNFRIGFIIVFCVILMLGLILINYLTT